MCVCIESRLQNRRRRVSRRFIADVPVNNNDNVEWKKEQKKSVSMSTKYKTISDRIV